MIYIILSLQKHSFTFAIKACLRVPKFGKTSSIRDGWLSHWQKKERERNNKIVGDGEPAHSRGYDIRPNALSFGGMWARETAYHAHFVPRHYSLSDKEQPSRGDACSLQPSPRLSSAPFITSAVSRGAEHVNICLSDWHTTKTEHLALRVFPSTVLPWYINNYNWKLRNATP